MVDVRSMIESINRLAFTCDQMQDGETKNHLKRAVGETMLGLSELIRPVARAFPDLDVE